MKFALFIISIVAALATSCQSASGQTFTDNTFAVHAEMMGERPANTRPKTLLSAIKA